MTAIDPFVLFPRLVKECELVKPAAPGLSPTIVAKLKVIVKVQSATDDFTDYNSRNLQRRFHVQTISLPPDYSTDPDLLLGMNIRYGGRTYRINQVSCGDDFESGRLPFISLMAVVAGRRSA